MNRVSKYFVSLFGIGFVPFAPGTLGSILAILCWYFSIKYLNIYFYFILFVVFFTSFKAIHTYLITQKEDPSEVIVDEFIGQSLPLLFLPMFDIYEIILAFISFRIFDIFKIYPVNKAENMKGATGIIMDDIIAGIYSLIIIMIYKIFISIDA